VMAKTTTQGKEHERTKSSRGSGRSIPFVDAMVVFLAPSCVDVEQRKTKTHQQEMKYDLPAPLTGLTVNEIGVTVTPSEIGMR
jgi:hypothetical protein